MRRKPQVFLLCMVVVAAIMVLASSLHDVQFAPGLSFASGTTLKMPEALPTIQVFAETPLWRILLFWLAGVAYLILFLLLLPAYLRKRIVRQLLTLALGVLAVLLLLHYRLLQLPALLGDPGAAAGAEASNSGQGLPMPEFRVPLVAPWLVYVVSLVILWAVVLLVWYVYRKWRDLGGGRLTGLGEIEDIARSSLNDLAAGRNWADVVIEAYARMGEAVGARRGLLRHQAATPREFAQRLTSAGLPADAVGGLTRLFEAVRYGGRSSNETEVAQAVRYLEAILRACEGSA